jgi:transposase
MKRLPRAVYTQEFRDQAVKLVLSDGLSASEAARRLSISIKTLSNWLRAAREGKLAGVGENQATPTDAQRELTRMKRELAEGKMDRDLLKKFAVSSTGQCNSSDLMAPSKEMRCQELVGRDCLRSRRKNCGIAGRMASL